MAALPVLPAPVFVVSKAPSVVLTFNEAPRASCCWTEDYFSNHILSRMSLPRESPPPQLPQIPLAAWQAMHDDFARRLTEMHMKLDHCGAPVPTGSFVKNKAMCFGCFLLNLGTCCILQGMNGSSMQKAMFDDLLKKHQPIFAQFGVGMSVHVTESWHNGGGDPSQRGPTRKSDGFQFDGQAVVPVVTAPSMVRAPVAMEAAPVDVASRLTQLASLKVLSTPFAAATETPLTPLPPPTMMTAPSPSHRPPTHSSTRQHTHHPHCHALPCIQTYMHPHHRFLVWRDRFVTTAGPGPHHRS